MTYLVNVPLKVARPIVEADPDVRYLLRLPGFKALEQVAGLQYELTFEIEAGSVRDAMDATEEVLVEYENALAAYHPTVPAEVVPHAA